MSMILKMPQPPRPVEMDATRWQIWRTNVQLALGNLLRRMGVPGAISDTEIHDEVTGQHIHIRVGVLSTCIQIDGRDYSFDRFTGKLVGTGMMSMGCAPCPKPLPDVYSKTC